MEETQPDEEAAGDDESIVGEDRGKAETTVAWEQEG